MAAKVLNQVRLSYLLGPLVTGLTVRYSITYTLYGLVLFPFLNHASKPPFAALFKLIIGTPKALRVPSSTLNIVTF